MEGMGTSLENRHGASLRVGCAMNLHAAEKVFAQKTLAASLVGVLTRPIGSPKINSDTKLLFLKVRKG